MYFIKPTILLSKRVYQLEIVLRSTIAQILEQPNIQNKIILQFIYHPSIKSIDSYLMAFDLDISQVCYNDQKVLYTWSFIRALNTKTFICFNLSTIYAHFVVMHFALQKYSQRDFKLLYPIDFQMNRFLSLTINELNLNQQSYYSTMYDQFGENNDHFGLQKKFVDMYINQHF
jgi:hypothetical protein